MTRPERGARIDPEQVPTTLKAPATQPGQLPAGGPWAYTDGEGQASVTDCPHEWSDERHADLHTRIDGDRLTVCLTPAAALHLARAVHRVCGLSEPILLERVETAVAGRPIATPVLNAAWKVEISDRHGTVILDCGCTRQGYAPSEVRRFAAVLASYADAVDIEPDPAEVEALMEAAGLGPDDARAVLAAGYTRGQAVDEGPGWMGSPVERRRP